MVVFRDENWMLRVLPGILQAFDSAQILTHSHSEHEVVVPNPPSIPQDNRIFIRKNFLDSDIIRMGRVHINRELGVW